MSIENAEFAVQRGGSLFKCKGSELKDKLQDGDLLAVQRAGVTSCWEVEGASVTNLNQIQDDDLFACTDEDGVTKSVTGAQFKGLFETKSDPLFELMADSQSHKIEMHGLDEYQAMIAELQDVGASEEEIFAALAVLSRVNGFRYTQGLLKFEGLSPDGRYCMSPGVVRAGDTETDSIFMGNSAYHVAGLLYAESKDNLKDCGGIKGYSGTGGKVESWQFGLTSKDRTPVLHMAAPLIFELAAAVEEGEIPYYINQNPKVYEIDESLEIGDADFKAATGVDLFIDLPSGDSGYLANVGVQVSGVPAGTWNFYGGSDFARWTYAYVDNNMVIQEWSSNNINHDTVAEHVAAWPAVSEVTDWSLAYN